MAKNCDDVMGFWKNTFLTTKGFLNPNFYELGIHRRIARRIFSPWHFQKSVKSTNIIKIFFY